MAYTNAEKARLEIKLQKVFKECIEEMEAIDIPFGTITAVEVNYRARSRWGQCRKSGSLYSININADLVKDGSEKGLKETIIHEIIHTCPNCMCHTGEWKRLAILVSDCYPYDITRTASAEDVGMSAEYIAKRTEQLSEKRMGAKYRFHCVGCGQKITRDRKSRFTEHWELYRCSRCHGKIVCDSHVRVGFNSYIGVANNMA